MGSASAIISLSMSAFQCSSPLFLTEKRTGGSPSFRSSCLVPGLPSGRWRLQSGRGGVRASSSSEETSSSGDKGQKTKIEPVPGWARPDSDEPPPWAKSERPATKGESQGVSIPFPVYLIGSFLVATAAIGSVFEYFNQNPVFGVVPPESPFYAPILGFFAISGLPTSAFLFLKAIKLANKASEDADKEDGVPR